MYLYMKQKHFSFKQDFAIYDSQQQPLYQVRGEFSLIRRKLHVIEIATGQELAYVEQKVLTLLPKMEIYIQGQLVASINQKLTFLKPKFQVAGLNWTVTGDFIGKTYQIVNANNQFIAAVSKKYLSWSDTFEINIDDQVAEIEVVIAVVLAIDAVLDAK